MCELRGFLGCGAGEAVLWACISLESQQTLGLPNVNLKVDYASSVFFGFPGQSAVYQSWTSILLRRLCMTDLLNGFWLRLIQGLGHVGELPL